MARKTREKNGYFGVFAALLAALIFSFVLALLLGSAELTVSELAAGLATGEGIAGVIVRQVRLPRVLAALLAGVGLSVSGVLLQGVTGNGLASPNVIGVNAGAGLAAIAVLAFLPGASAAMPLAAFVGAFAATLAIVFTAGRIGMSKTTVVLAGMALTTVLNAGISFIALLDADVAGAYRYFSVGTLSGVQLTHLLLPGVMIAVSLGLSLLLAQRLNVLCLGDAAACSLGVRVKSLRVTALLCASAAAAAVVSFAGLLGFVGLIVPHVARRLVGGEMRRALIAASLAGGTLVLLADMLGRTLFAPTELPVGIVMALIGAPFFLALLLRKGVHHA